MYTLSVLLLAAMIEVGGDAMIRHGLRGRGAAFIVLGLAMLGAYGFLVNLTRLDFSKLMGVYIAVFFVVAQILSVMIFKERLHLPVIVGGGLIVAGGVLMVVWQRS